MASNHTTNYNLNQWEATDKVLRTEFNEDNAKIDAALKANAAAIDTLETQLVSGLAGTGNCQIELKTYTGNGKYGEYQPTRLTFSAVPALVLIFGYRAICVHRGGSFSGTLSASTGSGTGVDNISFSWSGNTVSFYSNNPGAQLNADGQTYWAVAFYALDET